jgi:2-phospho-L-lactate/phosphoenolpyruvate guanylyltransferase
MPLWAIIPIKPLQRGKSRLSNVLTNQERINLNHYLLVHSIECLKQVDAIDQILVVSHDPAVLNLSEDLGARTIREGRNTNINTALEKATNVAIASGILSILIIPTDLPLMIPEDIKQLLSKSNSQSQIIISPDRNMNGTNALYITPPGILRYEFGESSFKKHYQQAKQNKISVEIYNNERLGFDLDLPEDLNHYKEVNTSDDLLMNLN